MPKVITLKEAKSLGLSKYYTGKPCPKGHICERLVDKRCCIVCRNHRVDSSVSKIHFSRKTAKSLRQKTYFTSRPCSNGHIAERVTKTGQCIICQRSATLRWRSSNPVKVKSAYSNYKRMNRGKVNANNVARQVRKIKATPSWSDFLLIKNIYEGADYLTRLTGIKWHVDHEVPLRGKNVCGLHVPENLQYLPAIENIRKSNNYG